MFQRTCFQIVKPLFVGLTLMIAVTFVTSMREAQGAIIADARGDFVPGTSDGDSGILPATGTGEWRYLASDTVNPTLDPSGLDLLLWRGASPAYWNPTTSPHSNMVGLFGSPGVASDEIQVFASNVSIPPPYTVLRWIAGAGEAGVVDIAGTIRNLPRAGTGDGSTLDIFADGVSLFSQFIAPNDSVGFAFNETATIGVGSTVDFVVGARGNDLWDLPVLKATIQPIPEPSTLVMWGLGILGLGAYHWRKRRK